MNIATFRIDDRLIHGQAVTAWMAYSDTRQILVVDNTAAEDTLQQSLLKVAAPRKVDLKIMSLEDARQPIRNDKSDTRIPLLVRSSKRALYLTDNYSSVESIDVGNIDVKEGKRKVLGNRRLNDEEEKDICLLAEKVEVEVRAVPNEHKQILMNLL